MFVDERGLLQGTLELLILKTLSGPRWDRLVAVVGMALASPARPGVREVT